MGFLRRRPVRRQSLGLGICGLVLAAAVFAGCIRFLEPRGSNVDYYLLDAPPDAGAAAPDASGLTVGLRRPRLASYLDAARIATRRGPSKLKFSEFDRWGEELDEAINRVVAAGLEQRSDIGTVETVPWSNGSAFDYVVQLDVRHFEGIGPPVPGPDADEEAPRPEGAAHVVVRWTVLGPEGDTVRARGATQYREEDWPVGDYEALVSRLNTALDVLADDLGKRLVALNRRSD